MSFAARRTKRLALALVLASLASGAGFVGCSAKHDPAPGEIFLAIDTNLKVPDDLDSIGISITNDEGQPQEDQIFPLGAGNDAQFPATFAVIRGTSLPVTIRVAGYKGANAVTVREATTTLPASGTVRLLPLDLDYLNEGMVSGTVATTVSQLTTTCAAGTTPIGGTCQTITLDSLSLPLYQASELGSSTDAGAVDIDQCYLGGSSLAPTSSGSACTAPVPAGAVNYGLTLPAGSAGWCNASSCVVPLLSAAGDGWNLDATGAIQLPRAVCDKGLPLFTVPVTPGCPSFSLQHPAHQDYGAIADGGGTDAGDGSTTVQPRSSVNSLSVDDTTVYIVSGPPDGPTVIETLPLGFTPGQRGPMVTIPYPEYSGITAARYPYFVLPVGSGATNVLVAVDLADASAPQTFGTDVDPGNFALTTGADGGTFLVYIDGYILGTPAAYAGNVAGPSDASAAVASGTAASAIAATSGDGGSLLAFAAGSGSATAIYSGTYPSFSALVTLITAEPQHLTFVDQRVAWSDSNDALYASGPGAPPSAPIPITTDSQTAVSPSTHRAVLAGGDGRIFYLSFAGTIYEAALDDAGSATTPVPTNLGNANAVVTALVVRQGTLYWADNLGGVYQQALSAIP